MASQKPQTSSPLRCDSEVCDQTLDFNEPFVFATSAESGSEEPLANIIEDEPTPGPSTIPHSSNLSGISNRRKHLYAEEVRSLWNLRRVIQKLGTKQQCIEFAEERELISKIMICNYHKKPMYLDYSSCQFGIFGIYRCRKSNCRTKYTSRVKGTWFENVHLPLPVVFELMYCFCNSYSYDVVQKECCAEDRETVLSHKTIADWYNYCSEVVSVYHLDNQIEKEKIGGPNCIVQIDESKFGKRKYNRGGQVEGHWVIGMISNNSDDLRLEVCPGNRRTADVLVPLIKKHVKVGSIIHNDSWRAYDCLPEHGYIHKKGNHSDPENRFLAPGGTHTQRIEGHWQGLKRRFNKDNYKGDFTNWLIEYSWKREIMLNKLDPFEELIKCIKYVYK